MHDGECAGSLLGADITVLESMLVPVADRY
jgi:hypothetical protein